MRLQSLLALFLLVCINTPNYSQGIEDLFDCYSQSQGGGRSAGTAEFGRDLTPKGDIKALIVFAAFENFLDEPLKNWPQAPDDITPATSILNDGLPDYVDLQDESCGPLLYNSLDDFLSPGPINDPSNLSVSKIFSGMKAFVETDPGFPSRCAAFHKGSSNSKFSMG